MIAAAYCRKSTEQGGLADEDKSVGRQSAHARAYAVKRGWTLADEYIYVDDGVSGAEFVKRPGFIRLMNALEPRPPFQVLIMSEESRLGRESIETGWALKQIMDAGVRVFFYLEDRERTLDSAMDKVMLSLANFAAEVEREKASQRVFDAARRRVTDGKIAGAKCYGYDNVPVLSTKLGRDGQPTRLHTLRRVNPAQAAVVQRIFALYAEGVGTTRIAQRLNAEGVPAPRRRGWAQPGIKHMLKNDLYRGVVVWGRIQNVVRKGTKRHRYRDQKDWLRLEDSTLRIIDEGLWERVQARRALRERALPRTTSGQLLGRPSWRDGHSEYLLPGFAECALCGGSIRTVHEKHGRPGQRVIARKYGCSTNQNRGDAACANRTRLRQEILDQALLNAVGKLLDVGLLEDAVDRAVEHLQAGHVLDSTRRAQVERELAQVQQRFDRLLDALGEGNVPREELVVRMNSEKTRKDALLGERAGLERVAAFATLDRSRLKAELVARAADVRTLLGQHVPQARQMLRKLLRDSVQMTPVVENGRRGYHFEGRLVYDGLLSGTVLSARAMGGIQGDRCAAAPGRARCGCGCRRAGTGSPR